MNRAPFTVSIPMGNAFLPPPPGLGRPGPLASRIAALVLAGSAFFHSLHAGESASEIPPPPGSGLPQAPQPVTEADFAALKAHSPFLRSLDLSETLSLVGIARIEGDLFATFLDRNTRKTHVVTGSANSQGWRLLGIEGNETDLKTVTARLSAAGGEVFSIRFDENQLQPPRLAQGGRPGGPPGAGSRSSSSPAADYREGISGDGFRGPPPPEVVAKLSRLSDEQRERLIRQIGEIRDRNRELSSEDRQVLFIRMLDRAVQERGR